MPKKVKREQKVNPKRKKRSQFHTLTLGPACLTWRRGSGTLVPKATSLYVHDHCIMVGCCRNDESRGYGRSPQLWVTAVIPQALEARK